MDHSRGAKPKPASGAAGLGSHDLTLEQALQDLGSREPVLESAVELGAQVLGGGGKAEVAQVLPETLVGGRLDAHRAVSS
jgi:hypothetical protein